MITSGVRLLTLPDECLSFLSLRHHDSLLDSVRRKKNTKKLPCLQQMMAGLVIIKTPLM